jgi:hypothetical protein
MRKVVKKGNSAFIRAAFVLLVVLVAVYIPLKIHIARTDTGGAPTRHEIPFSIFVTGDLAGFREPCG